ncbi:unnamed protein product [Peronospora belbahrii]|uniref:Translation initiation factor IF-3 n=1 Tax=Peronospora belbahrii TaxID=622444 RepID=A0ABN8CT26_9STRA|nr:unnamed protein product [Peronospora belbahrii]
MLSLVRPAVRAALYPRRMMYDPHLLLRRGFVSAETKWGVTNEHITARVVNIVEEGGHVRTDIPIHQAIQDAQSRGVDLVQMSPVGKLPAVCRLFDAKKRYYELKKANKKTSKQQRPKPDKEPNDLNMKVEQLKRFLNKGHKVKVTIKFKQAYHLKEQSLEQLKKIESRIDAATGMPSGHPREQFGAVYVFYSPAI